MSRANSEVCKFLTESYEKIERQRRRWKNLNRDKGLDSAETNKDTKGFIADNEKDKTVNSTLNTVKDLKSPKKHRHVKRELDVNRVFGILEMKQRANSEDSADAAKVCRSNSDKDDIRMMRPVNPEHAEIIYKDTTNDGREHYLKIRSRMKPDEKYYYHQCSSWEYGWRLRDSYFGKHTAPTHGRYHLFTRDGMSRSGPQPDSYYQ